MSNNPCQGSSSSSSTTTTTTTTLPHRESSHECPASSGIRFDYCDIKGKFILLSRMFLSVLALVGLAHGPPPLFETATVEKFPSHVQSIRRGLQGMVESSNRPIIYTFHTFIEGETGMTKKADEQLMRAWQEEWSRQGWEPRVIGLDMAEQHPDFVRLNAMLDPLDMKVYDRYCFLRWLAMSVAGGGWMIDYDTFPLHPFDGNVLPNEGTLTIHEYSKNGGVPDMVSGSADEFNRVANLLFEDAYQHQSEAFWSDMFALHSIYTTTTTKGEDKPVYVREGNVIPGQVITKHTKGERICKRTKGKYAIHFSHYAMEFGGTPGAGPEHRGEIAQKWLKEWRELCLEDKELDSQQ